MDWRTTQELLVEIQKQKRRIDSQKHWKEHNEEARKDDLNNNRGFLVLNPDLDFGDYDPDGLIVVNPDDDNGHEYRVVIDPAMKGMKDPETGDLRAGFWLAPLKPFSAIIPPLLDISDRPE